MLTREAMPKAARGRRWPVRFDHCFQRILLDNALGGRWYDHVTGRPAYRSVQIDILRQAIRLGEEALAGTVDLARLNTRSLAWRRR